MTTGFKHARQVKSAVRGAVQSIAIDKLSHVKLSQEQTLLREKVLAFTRKHLKNYNTGDEPAMFVIQGDAGTGKSVVLNSLFNEIQRLSSVSEDNDVLFRTRNYLVVNHPEMLKLYLRISKGFKYIARSSLERPTSLINALQKKKELADVVIVDEAHLLATSKDAFKRFYGDNHLQELLSLAKVLILVYDDKQALRMGCYWDESTQNGANLKSYYSKIPAGKKDWYNLKQQFRVAAPDDVLQWIDEISTEGAIPQYPRSSLTAGPGDFDFKIWDDCGAMYEALRELDGKVGQCRMLATYDFPYRLDGKDYFVTCGDNFKVRWDRYTPREVLPWSERPDTIDEVGSVYTIQGFDLNYAGVILGRSVGYDAVKDCIQLKPELYDDHAGFTKKKNISDVSHVKNKIIMNSINVLLTRGVKGLYVYAWDPALRERLKQSWLEASN
ncbi:hypothetical protein HG536_0A08420 [Torulaspora globosa]|uniref:Schlafen group 3-like DNA/RNA helicase domain-containing protein n=1 Tax=Torulaspora globosa TaxID=48254 RepID=A0A7G3ZBZ1_9SACH|nr:uncharacterized protein HG536_0A08420 [Torulaspora globosa]QLL31027.1 hypothetical protein HG536_0A08420 [Torulaspora globosa]